jgi:two-component system NtrC family sensor kinase
MENISFQPPVHELLRKQEGALEFTNQEGLQVLAAFAPIQETGWGVVVSQSMSESYSYVDQIVRVLEWTSVVCLSCALIFGVLLTWRLLSPVASLTEGVRRVSKGELDFQIPVLSRDEIGDLAGTFNEMTGELRRKKEETDLSYRRVLEAQKQLTQSEKMAAVGQMAAGLAHEIYNPLNVISGFGELLLGKTSQGDPRRPPLEDIVRETARCQKLVGNLLDFAKPKEPQKTPSEINPLIQETLALILTLAKSNGIEVEPILSPDLPVLPLDRDQMKQVLLNLLLNACQEMSHGGRLTVESRRTADGVEVLVQDTGRGVPPEHMASLFTPFFTTKADGTGLGLALSHALVKNHGGVLRAENRPGQGAQFTIALPGGRP